MKMKHILIALCVIIFLALNFGLKPYLKRQGAIKTANEILDLWVEGNLMASSVYWEKKQEYPPLYGITSYKITKTEFYKEDKFLYAKIFASLEFTSNNLYAEKSRWTFVLKRNVGSWKVADFYPSQEDE